VSVRHNKVRSKLKNLAYGLVGLLVTTSNAWSYAANKVWFEFRDNGRYRVIVNYTIPELKEFREEYVEFANRREAETFYWQLIRGADFYPPDPKRTTFQKSPPTAPVPW